MQANNNQQGGKEDISYIQDHFVRNVWDFCNLCPNKTNINWKCVQCQQFLCEICYNSHIKGRITREHVIFAKYEKDKEPELLRIYKCQKHTDKNITMYCTDDEVPICTKCTTHGHRGHNVDELGITADKIKEIREAIDKWKEGSSSLQAIEKAESDMTDYRTRNIEEIKSELMAKSPRISRNLIENFEIERRKMIQYFTEKKQQLLLDINRGQNHIADINHAVKYFRDEEIIREGQQMLRKIKLNTKLIDLKCKEKYMPPPVKLMQKCFFLFFIFFCGNGLFFILIDRFTRMF